MEGRKTILWVDDVAMFRELGALFLARSGRVLTAQGGEEAIEIAREQRPDVIVSDLLMPGMSGDELCRFFRTDPDLHEVPFVMIVGTELGEDYGRAVRAGANDVLTKPISRVGLNASVNRFLRESGTCGLPRVPLVAPVDFDYEECSHHGTARNISRGGLFLETGCELPDRCEVQLHFRLPGEERRFSPTAAVMWQGGAGNDLGTGHGMRFVSIDGTSVRILEEYVGERAGLAGQEVYPA